MILSFPFTDTKILRCGYTKNPDNDQSYEQSSQEEMSQQNAFAHEQLSVIRLWCQLAIWLRQFDIYHFKSQDQCGVVICFCYNSGSLSYVIPRVSSSFLSRAFLH